MKLKYLFTTICAILAGISNIFAQNNVLSIPDVLVAQGKSIALPVNLDNTADVVALQFTLTTPEGIALDAFSAALTERSDGHSVNFQKIGANTYMAMVLSSMNNSVKGRTGKLLSVTLSASSSLEEGSVLPLSLSGVVISARDGSNLTTGFSAGKVTIAKSPDLEVSNVSIDKTTIVPNEKVTVGWQVANIGGLATTAGWNEQILLESTNGTTKLLGTVYHDGPLNPNGVVSRNAELNVPAIVGIGGDAKIRVKLTANSNAGEPIGLQDNNTAVTNQSVIVKKLLALTPEYASVDESQTKTVRFQLTRSGNTINDEVFNLTHNTDARISLPETVTISKGQSGVYFYAQVTANGVLDNDSVVNLAVSGNEYPEIAAKLVIEDDTYPSLSITTDAQDVTEGGSIKFTISTERISTQDIEVKLSCDLASRFEIPSNIVIPAGQQSVEVMVNAIEDNIPDVEQVVTFIATAAGHNNASINTVLVDNDVPTLKLEITPNAISEGAGPLAVAAKLMRTDNIDKLVTVKLSDDSDGNIYYGRQTIEMAAGVKEVTVNLGPIDNAIVDGERTYNISAAVFIASCSCNASNGTSGGVVSVPLTIYDNDGPTLTMTTSVSILKEGGEIEVTVKRNTNTSEALTVNISSDHETSLEYPSTVIIPAGKTEATFTVKSKGNDTIGDGFTAMLTATADGFATGNAWFTVSDQTLPDAQITDISVSAEEVEVGGKVTVDVTIANTGSYELPELTKIGIYTNNSSTAVATLYLQAPLGAGESVLMSREITMPSAIGTYRVYAVANDGNGVKELVYTNNTSQMKTVKTISPFSVSVSTDKQVYKQGENVVLSGTVTGTDVENKEVEIYVINDNYRHVITATTDAQGHFSADYKPYSGQMGHFIAGTCYPKEGLTTEMATFDVYGLRRTNNEFITCEVKQGEPYTGTIQIENPGLLPQTIASFEVISKPADCNVVLNAPQSIAANGKILLDYELTGNAVTETKDWETIKLKLVSREGCELLLTLYYYCAAQHAVLTPNTNSIKTTMVKGASREYLLNIMNTGKGTTGKINVLLPNVEWMKLTTPSEMAALEYGETATIGVQLTPTDDLQLNVPLTGSFVINCKNGQGTVVNYNIEPVSETTGTLNIDVVDEYTYYTSEKPHVAGANVVVKHPVTGVIVAQGKTNSDGVFSIELPEGYYGITVSEDHHNSITGNILVDPGTVNNQEIFLSYTAVTYSWNVVETEIEDKYIVETTVKYETNVPKPVVIVSLPSERPTDGDIINIVVTNKGLINAQHVDMNLNCTTGYELELLNPEQVEILAPQQSYVFYARFKKSTSSGEMNRVWGNPNVNVDCISVFAGAVYDYMCGNNKNFEEALAQNGWGDCIGDGGPGAPSHWRIQPVPHTGPDWPGTPGGGPGGGSVEPRPSDNKPEILETLRQWYCDLPCGKELTQALACEAADRIKDKIIPDWLQCAYNLANQTLHGDWRGRVGAMLDCAGLPNPFEDGCWDSYIRCMLEHYGVRFSRSIQSRVSSKDRGYETAINFYDSEELIKKEGQAYRRIAEEHFGSTEWLECDNQELAAILNYISIKGKDYLFTVEDLASFKPQSISDEKLEAFVERINNTNQYESVGYESITNYIDPDTIDYYSNIIDQCEEIAKAEGWENLGSKYETAYNELKDFVSEGNNSVCASVAIKLSQSMVMTRQAFRGTLSVFNGNETTAMQDVKLMLNVTNQATGQVATSHEFQINAESLDGFAGELDLTSGWVLDANQTGTATVLFIPTKYAAPNEPIDWAFGGTLSYIDPFTGQTVERELYPVTLTVKPSPNLDLTYFMQRDIIGDDPLTEVVEPSEEAEFALLINNIGYGDANNVQMATDQPKIIENEKGLYIDFELISSQLNGGDKTLALGGSVATDFGTIPAMSTAYAQWWIKSSLLGHFTDYNVEATHVTSYGNPDLSLLNEVTIHELIRSLEIVDGGNKMVGFLTNDIADAEDMPDMIYLSNGEIESVATVQNAVLQKISDTDYLLKVSPKQEGWNYGNVSDLTYGAAKLKSVVRQSDGTEIPHRNFWQTDRTLRDGKDPLYENRIHFADNLVTSQEETYILTFEPQPKIMLEVAEYTGVPKENTVFKEQLTELTVRFNKPIKAESFTTEDISINCQGTAQDASQITITKVNEQEYKLGLNEVTLGDGYYVLTVQTANIIDIEGFTGSTDKQTSWIQFVDGKVALKLSASPVEGGTISPSSGRFDYNSDVTVKATPNEGYDFVAWMTDNVNVSMEREYTHHLTDNTELKAIFSIKHYNVTIDYDATQGTVEGAASGIYEYGTQLQLAAIPFNEYTFDAWLINDERDQETEHYTITVNGDMKVEALFKELTTDIETADSDAHRIRITPMPLRDMMFISGNFNEMRMVNIYDMRGMKCLTAQNVQPNQSIYVGKLSAGIYYIQIITDRGAYSAKVLKH